MSTLKQEQRPAEYSRALEELKNSVQKTADIVKKIYELGKKYNFSKKQIRNDIKEALVGKINIKYWYRILPAELKNPKQTAEARRKVLMINRNRPHKKLEDLARAKPENKLTIIPHKPLNRFQTNRIYKVLNQEGYSVTILANFSEMEMEQPVPA